MKKLFFRKNNKGMTMAEVLIVVAIIGVLMGLAIPNIMQQQRNLKKMELDRTAKEIYLAVQNSFITLDRNGHLNEAINGKLQESGSEQKDAAYPNGKLPSDYQGAFEGTFYTFYSGDGSSRLYSKYLETKSLKSLGRNFVVEYTSSGDVYSVFITEDENVATQLKKAGQEADLNTLDGFRDNNRVGYYSTLSLDDRNIADTDHIHAEILKIEDGDELIAKIGIKDAGRSFSTANYEIKYKLKFTTGDKSVEKDYSRSDDNLNLKYEGEYLVFNLVLDSLPGNIHFYGNKGIGEDFDNNGSSVELKIEDATVSYNFGLDNKTLYLDSDPAPAAFNPLHATALGTDSTTGEIYVSCARHLNNLNSSYFTAPAPAIGEDKTVNIVQLESIDASGLPAPIRNDVLFSNSQTSFDGKGLEIRNLSINSADGNCAGLFAELKGCTVQNVVLVDPKVNVSAENTGALCGKVSGGAIENCGARKTAGSADYDIDGNGSLHVGGLIGLASNANITQSYAAVNVHGSGGFAGELENCKVSYCYSSGIVTGGGGETGGFVARAITNSIDDIHDCYTTSDVKARNTCGGFAYKINGATDCTSYGRVGMADDEYAVNDTMSFFAVEDPQNLNYYPGCAFLFISGIYNDPAGGFYGLDCGLEYNYLEQNGGRLGVNYDSSLTPHNRQFPFEYEGFNNPHYGDWPHSYYLVQIKDNDLQHEYLCSVCGDSDYSRIWEDHQYQIKEGSETEDGFINACIICGHEMYVKKSA